MLTIDPRQLLARRGAGARDPHGVTPSARSRGPAWQPLSAKPYAKEARGLIERFTMDTAAVV